MKSAVLRSNLGTETLNELNTRIIDRANEEIKYEDEMEVRRKEMEI